MRQIIIVDCYNLGHIAFHAMGNLDYHGRRTGVTYGFLNKVLLMAKTFNTRNFIFAWDSRQSVRKLIYEPYKAREGKLTIRGTDEIMDYAALHEQMDDLHHNVLRELGFANTLLRTGLEADDVIAAVIKYGKISPEYVPPGEDIEWVIASTDRDLYQLLAPNVRMYKIQTKRIYTINNFIAEYGIKPEQWVYAKAMGGCDSDHVGGIEGISDPAKSTRSRALQIIRGELIKGKHLKDVRSDLGQFIINRNTQLISLPYVPFAPPIQPDNFDRGKFMKLFDTLGFTSFLKPERWQEWEVCFGLGTTKKEATQYRGKGRRLGTGIKQTA